MQEQIIHSLHELRENQPLVHNITNDVVTNTTANALLALGASPIMSNAIEEVADMVGITSSLVINTGTLTSSSLKSMLLATETSSQLGKQWILDPVGAGATTFRLTSNKQLLENKPSVVRGNASEIKALFTGANEGKGVDSSSSSESTLHFIQEKAREHQLIIAVTGATDYVTDGYEVYKINNGHPMMAKVTGTGCTATAIIGAFLAICDTPLTAAVSGLTCLGIAGELASMDCPGPGSLQLRMLDELFRLDQASIQKFEKSEQYEKELSLSLLPSFRLPLPGINGRERFKKPGIELLGLPVKLLPASLVNKPLTKAINHIFHNPIEEGDFDFLEDRCLKIHITDIDVSFYISFDGSQLTATSPRHFDVQFQGDSKAFLKLASRQEDPDTLFFQRSLMIEGDTELGLGVKNLLDSLELEQLPIPVQKLAWFGQQLQKKMPLTNAH